MSDTTSFFVSNQCTPAIRTNVATCGLMTACDAHIPAPSELEELFKSGGDYLLFEALFLWQWEANANQALQSNLFKFLMASKVNMKARVVTEKLNAGLMMIRPYVNVKRKGLINNNFWKAEGGTLALDTGVADAAGTYWRMDLSSLNGIPVHTGWFNERDWVFVTEVADDGTSIHWAGEVVFREVVGAVVRVTMIPRMTNSALPAARKANPVHGAATRGSPNVSDYESYCAQPPGLITSTLEPYWIGETRTTFCEDELYNRWRDLVLSDNPLYRELFDLPTQEYNKQVAEDFQRRHVESFFNGTALPNQSVETLNDLENIETSEDSIGGVRCIGKRAHPIGIYEQHVQCERVVDAQGLKLNIPALTQAINKMMRIRKSAGSPSASQKTFELAMPSTYAVNFHQGMLEYYDTQWKGKVEWVINIVSKTETSPFGFKFKRYPLVWPDGVELVVITDDYFDDYAAFMHELAVAFANPNYDNLGRRIWIMDWSSIYMGIFETNRYSNSPGSRWNEAQNLGIADPCVPRSVKQMITMTTFKWTAVADRTVGNLIIENLSNEVPEHDAIGDTDYDENS